MQNNKSVFRKIGTLKRKEGTFTGRDGREHAKYAEVGSLISSPHGSHVFIRLNATAYSDSVTLAVCLNDGIALSVSEDNLPAETPAEASNSPVASRNNAQTGSYSTTAKPLPQSGFSAGGDF